MNTVTKNDIEKLYSPAEVAKLLHLHPKTVRNYILDGKLKAFKTGRKIFISEKMLLDYCNENFKSNTNRNI